MPPVPAQPEEVRYTARTILAFSSKDGKIFKDDVITVDSTLLDATVKNTITGEVIRANEDLDLNDLVVVVRPF